MYRAKFARKRGEEKLSNRVSLKIFYTRPGFGIEFSSKILTTPPLPSVLEPFSSVLLFTRHSPKCSRIIGCIYPISSHSLSTNFYIVSSCYYKERSSLDPIYVARLKLSIEYFPTVVIVFHGFHGRTVPAIRHPFRKSYPFEKLAIESARKVRRMLIRARRKERFRRAEMGISPPPLRRSIPQITNARKINAREIARGDVVSSRIVSKLPLSLTNRLPLDSGKARNGRGRPR